MIGGWGLGVRGIFTHAKGAKEWWVGISGWGLGIRVLVVGYW